jgi:hypothetical protein
MTPALELAVRQYARRLAVTVGINAYHDPIPALSAAVSDAEHMATLLRALGFDSVLSVSDAQANRAGLLDLLEQKVPLEAGPNDLVVVFFAGHGATVGNDGYILPQDATRDIVRSGISVQRLKESSLRMKAKHVLYLLDACFSGSMLRRVAVGTDTNSLAYWQQAGGERVVQILTGGGANETTSEAQGWGLFTRALYQGLQGAADANGDVILTLEELAAYSDAQVVAGSGGRQHPQWGNIEGAGTVLLWDARRLPDSARTERISRELLPGLEEPLRAIHDLMDRGEWKAAERAVRDLAVRTRDPELNLLLSEIYVGQDALGNAALAETELVRVEQEKNRLTEGQLRRLLRARERLERARRHSY